MSGNIFHSATSRAAFVAMLLFVLAAAVCASGCSDDPTSSDGPEKPEQPDGPDEGQIALRLETVGPTTGGGPKIEWQKDDAVIVNRRTYYVRFDSENRAVLYVDKAEDDTYTAYYPASLYSKSDNTFTLPFAQLYREGEFEKSAMPMYGVGTDGERLPMAAACGLLHLNVAGEGYATSIRIAETSDKNLAGVCAFDKERGILATENIGTPCSGSVVLNCAGTGDTGAALSTAGTDFYLVLPAGTYNGFSVRISDRSHKFVEQEFASSYTVRAGETLSLPTVNYAPDKNLLYAQHFDNCTWGGDIVAGQKGLGRGSSGSDFAPKAASGTETALQVKLSSTAGTSFVTTTDYTDHTYESAGLELSQAYLRNRGLDDWRTLYYVSEYNGYICCGDNEANANRGIIRTPCVTSLGNVPCTAEISFRLCLEEGFECTLELQSASHGSGDKLIASSGTVPLTLSIDGTELDISPATSRRLSQASPARPKILLTTGDIAAGRWHEVKLTVGAFSSNTSLRLMPTAIRNAKNIYYIDDLIIRRIPYGYEGDYTVVEPTTEPGDPAEDISRLRLRVGSTMSLYDDAAYLSTRALGYTYISPGFGSKENAATAYAKWEADAKKYAEKARANGLKIWCMHLPYGNQTEERYYDLCAPDAEHRDSTVRYFSQLIRAAEALEPAYLLIHCNQTLKFSDGSSAASLAQSLYELQLVADEIGTQIAVENMSCGVGAEAAVLSKAIDEANAMTSKGALRKPVKIAFDIGHANIWLGIDGNKTNVIDWMKTAGTRIGTLHMHDNRGTGIRERSYQDDHLDPGYSKNGALYAKDKKYGSIGERGLWGEVYKTLLGECRYRGVFDYEAGSTSFGQITPLSGESEDRYDQIKTPWHAVYNYDTYVYPAFRAACGK
ncbi:MAG: sugar phosphate isomerase/epimerase [Alistipes sp.]|nr:sugar phosphate isomerase/epimerase [Alistipes sp.]